MAASFRIDAAPLGLLQQTLPRLLSNLSIARAQIAIDQIRATIQTQSLDRLTFLSGSSSSVENARFESTIHADSINDPRYPVPEQWLGAAIAIQQSDGDDKPSDMATIVHAGSLEHAKTEEIVDAESNRNTPTTQLISEFTRHLDIEFRNRGVEFVQWATDPIPNTDTSLQHWCEGLGFQPIGTLDYMNCELADQPESGNKDPANEFVDETTGLRFVPLSWDQSDPLKDFAQLVERTYEGTLDCPGLASYRTPAQTLEGYRVSAAFDPSMWFRVVDQGNREVGCLVLASHRDANSDQSDSANTVTEIVYMGLTAEARGKGMGRQLVGRAIRMAQESGRRRIILAVDQVNQPALSIYQHFGFRVMLSETVWVKRLASVNEEESCVANS